ncbi:MAG: BrnT family toxin [Moraxellaceae bacterium]|jgi:uncharacterized DUF497 family protein
MNITYDPNKAASNQRKHGVSFEEAQTALLDEYALVQEDGDSETEQRFVLLGRSAKERLLVVVYAVWDEEANLIRLISARLATNRERDSYESGI